ncbi:hypothetical protein P3452_23755, partial [Vibrio parahaemolyticus]|nr:hypothetical protein [Vibrio parahaemolyticus]
MHRGIHPGGGNSSFHWQTCGLQIQLLRQNDPSDITCQDLSAITQLPLEPQKASQILHTKVCLQVL